MSHSDARAAFVACVLCGLLSACTGGGGAGENANAPSAATTQLTQGEYEERTPETLEPPSAPVLFEWADLDRSELLGLWAADRAAAVDRIVTAGWGVDGDSVLHGPGGLTIDLSECPDDWQPDPSLSDEVELLLWYQYDWVPGPESGQAYLNWLGDEAVAGGRPISVRLGGYEAWDPSGSAEQRVEGEKANRRLVSELGSDRLAVLRFNALENNRSLPALFDEACVPLLGVRNFLPLQPVNPWVAPTVAPPQTVEAAAWVAHHAERFPGGLATLLVLDNFWGHRFRDAFAAAASEAGVDWRDYPHDPMDATAIEAVVDQVIADRPVAIYLATAGVQCVSAVQYLRAAGYDGEIVLPGVCTVPSSYLDPMEEAANGSVAFFGAVSAHAGPYPDSPFALAAREATPEDQRDWSLLDDDWLLMWHAVEVLKIAAELPGGLTRPNIVLAMWSFEGRFPFAAGPLTAQWPDDLALIDELAPLVYDVGQRRWLLPGADGS